MYRLLCLLALASITVAFQYPFFDDFANDGEELGDPVVIDVAQGRIVGQVKVHANFTYHSFESIPYARPPVGVRRFKNPEPADPWVGELNATHAAPSCTQFLLSLGQEDCLFLNVYTPVDSVNQSEALPVMAFLHGGAFATGGSRTYRGAQPLVQHNVILVTMNYRLGVLGFLSTEDEAAPGNLGLKDQTLALRWIQDNIAAFGGDPARVTLFGESAGAASVHYQMLTPYAAGLFSGAILQSGQSFGQWSRGRDFLKRAQDVARRFDCPINDTNALIACLQGEDNTLIEQTCTEFAEWNYQPFYFAPRIDGDYIPDDPVTLTKEGRYSHVPIMMGINKHEGTLVSGELYANNGLLNSLVENFTINAQPSLHLFDDEEPLETATTAYNYYLGGLNFQYEDADNVSRLYGDRFFTVPMDWMTQLMADVDVVYTWELIHRGESGMMDLLLNLNDTLAARWVSHGDELQYLFSPFFLGNPSNAEDALVKDLYSTMWANFAKTRNPTPDDSLGFIWERSNSVDLRYLVISANLPLKMGIDYRTTERAFWESLPLRINDLLTP